MKNRLARSFMCSVIEPDTSIRQNITACAIGFGTRLEAAVAQIDRIDDRGCACVRRSQPLELGLQRGDRPPIVAARPRASAISPRSAAISSGFGRRSAMRRDRLLRMVRGSARLAGEPVTRIAGAPQADALDRRP